MDFIEATVRILFAVLMGGMIGVEREFRDKSAGFRTMMIISVGAALFTVLSLAVSKELSGIDPSRIISYIVGGIGFLGAGVIIKDGTTVKGITTAATIWLSAALGIGAGLGFFTITAFTALVVLFVLVVLPVFEHWIDSRHEFRIYKIELKAKHEIDEVLKVFHQYGLRVSKHHQHKSKDAVKLDVYAEGSPARHEIVSGLLIDDKKVISF